MIRITQPVNESIVRWITHGHAQLEKNPPYRFISHLDTIRRAVNDDLDDVIIADADILIDPYFLEKGLPSILNEIINDEEDDDDDSDSLECVYLGAIISSWNNIQPLKSKNDKTSLLSNVTSNVDGSSMYWISRDGLEKILKVFDRPLRQISIFQDQRFSSDDGSHPISYLMKWDVDSLFTVFQKSEIAMSSRPWAYRPDSSYLSYYQGFGINPNI